MKKSYAIIIYAGNTHFGTALRSETIKRCDAAIELIREGVGCNFVIYLGAGKYPGVDTAHSVAELMERYIRLQLHGAPQRDAVTFRVSNNTKAWGTVNESRAIAAMLKADNESQAIVFSSEYHMRRIKFVWWLIEGFEMNYHSVIHTTPFMRKALEIPKFGKVIWQLIIKPHYSWRGSFIANFQYNMPVWKTLMM